MSTTPARRRAGSRSLSPSGRRGACRAELEGEAVTISGFLRSAIETQEDADRAGVWAKRLTDLLSQIEALQAASTKLQGYRLQAEAERDAESTKAEAAVSANFSLSARLSGIIAEEKERADKAERERDAAVVRANEEAGHNAGLRWRTQALVNEIRKAEKERDAALNRAANYLADLEEGAETAERVLAEALQVAHNATSELRKERDALQERIARLEEALERAATL